MKPIVDIQQCDVMYDSLGRERLTGIVLNYPESHKLNFFKDGDSVITSPIISKNVNTVETVRTIYNILSWRKHGKTTA
jgi:hypothetical protein